MRLGFVILRSGWGRDEAEEVYEKLRDYLVDVLGKPYEVQVGSYVRAGLGKSKDAADPQSLFCSQLVAGTYQAMGLLPKSKAIAGYFPRDFSKNLPLIPPSELGPLHTHSSPPSPFSVKRFTSCSPCITRGAPSFRLTKSRAPSPMAGSRVRKEKKMGRWRGKKREEEKES